MKPIRILIVDDHSLFRKGIRSVLDNKEDFLVVAEAADGQEAIELARSTQPDVILMDIHMPNCSGLEATREIKKQDPKMRIIMLTVSDAEADLFESVKSGAQGYMQKDLDAGELIPALKRVMKGEALISGLLAARILEDMKKDEHQTRIKEPDALTSREVEILHLVSTGYSNRQISETLVISENTVKHHLSSILEKLHLKNRVQLALYAVKKGMD